MATEQGDPPVDTTMWTSLLHAGLAGSFLKLPHVGRRRRRPERAWRSRRDLRHPLGLDVDQPHRRQLRPARHSRDLEPVPHLQRHLGLRPRGRAESRWTAATATSILANAEKTFANGERDIGQILEAGAIPVTLGGDHSVTIPAVRAVRKQVDEPGPGADRHPSRHRDGRRRRAAQPLLPDHASRGRRVRPEEDRAAGHQRLDESPHRAALLPRAGHHRGLARGHLGARGRGRRSSRRSRSPAAGPTAST